MSTDRELMQMALDALEDYEPNEAHNVAEALRARLEQCDAGEICLGCRVCPDIPWQGLTDEEVAQIVINYGDDGCVIAQVAEEKLKEKNRG